VRIGGFLPFSLIDFPGGIACVLFTQGCPFRCHYCHNPELVEPHKFGKVFPEEEFFKFLKTRKGKLDGVVITGGEPTIQADLFEFIKEIKKEGFRVKLDTNGTQPSVVRRLIEEGLVDYFAMDIKAPLDKYEKVVGIEINSDAIRETIQLIMKSPIDYEFRTTALKNLLSSDDIIEIVKTIKGAKKYVLQRFLPNKILNSAYEKSESIKKEDFELLYPQLSQYVKSCVFR
jgi:pyruvate formate lyase activating enzyme